MRFLIVAETRSTIFYSIQSKRAMRLILKSLELVPGLMKPYVIVSMLFVVIKTPKKLI